MLPPLAATVLSAAAPTAVAAASGGQVSTSASLPGDGQLSPGDVVSAGYDLAYAAAHPAATVHVSGATAGIALYCKQNQPPVRRLVVTMRGVSFAIKSGDTAWHPTASSSDAAGYQGAAAVPDACAGKKMWTRSVSFVATLASDDSRDPVRVRFHAAAGATDCSGQSAASSGCDSAWTAAASTLPASAAAPAGVSGSGGGSPRTPSAAAAAPRSAGARETTTTHMGVAAAHNVPAAAPEAGVVQFVSPPALSPPTGFTLPVVGPGSLVVTRSKPTARFAIAGSVFDGLPMGVFGAVAAIDVLLAAAVVLRHRRISRDPRARP